MDLAANAGLQFLIYLDHLMIMCAGNREGQREKQKCDPIVDFNILLNESKSNSLTSAAEGLALVRKMGRFQLVRSNGLKT